MRKSISWEFEDARKSVVVLAARSDISSCPSTLWCRSQTPSSRQCLEACDLDGSTMGTRGTEALGQLFFPFLF